MSLKIGKIIRTIFAVLVAFVSIGILAHNVFSGIISFCFAYLVSPLSDKQIRKKIKVENERWLYTIASLAFATSFAYTVVNSNTNLDNDQKEAINVNQQKEEIAKLKKEIELITKERDKIKNNNQEKVVAAAKSYIEYAPMSKEGMIEQLKYENFSQDDAEYAVNHANIKWDEQASRSAVVFIGYSNPTTNELKEQLQFEKFSDEEINYALEHNGF